MSPGETTNGALWENDEMSLDPDSLAALLRARRTTKKLDPDRPVDPAVITELCTLATWAPNHRRTEPWRFAIFTGEGRHRLGETIGAAMEASGAPEFKVMKTRTKFLRSAAVIVVGSAPGSDEIVSGENRDAVAAGVQNLLLGATARGLATLWSSIARPTDPGVLDLCGFEPGTFAVGAIYLAHPTGDEGPGKRSEPRITWHS